MALPLIPIGIGALITGAGFSFGSNVGSVLTKLFYIVLAVAVFFLIWKFI